MAVQSQTIPAHGEQPAAKPKAVSKADKHIWGIFIALCIISTIELYSASSREVAGSSIGVMGPILRHIVMLAGGTFVVWFLSRRHYSDFIPFTLGFALYPSGFIKSKISDFALNIPSRLPRFSR